MRYIALLTLIALLSSCLNKASTKRASFMVKTTNHTNKGSPVYVVIKTTDMTQFLLDDYRKIASQTFGNPGEEGKVLTSFLVPGMTKTFNINVPKENAAAAYFLFTAPGEEWKCIINSDKSQNVKILLGENEIQSITTFGS